MDISFPVGGLPCSPNLWHVTNALPEAAGSALQPSPLMG
jgi:hypothetical protein